MWVESNVRAAVEDVGRQVALASTGPGAEHLEAAWGQLVELLALGPAPELRACPHCAAVGMGAATRCGSCWRPLTPAPAGAARGTT